MTTMAMDKNETQEMIQMCDGDFRAWIDQGAIHMKAVDRHGDPIEVSREEIRLLAQELLKLADEIDANGDSSRDCRYPDDCGPENR
jgi:hypothetical protein